MATVALGPIVSLPLLLLVWAAALRTLLWAMYDVVCDACFVGSLFFGVVGVRLRGLGCCRVLGLQLRGAHRLVARFGWDALWRDACCERRASCMVYRVILVLF